MPVEVMRSFEETFGCIVLEGYGLSETSPVASFNHPHAERKPGSIGTPDPRRRDAPGRRRRQGRRRRARSARSPIRGENVMKGYWNRPEDTAKAIPDGWFRTGDLARQDDDGYYFIVDRKKEMIIRGGYNVYPREIEEALYEHPAVAEAACIGITHPDLGEEVVAAVALKPGASAERRRAARLRQGAGGRLQVPAARVAGRRAAEGPDRQDPPAVRGGARGSVARPMSDAPAVAAGLRQPRSGR